MCVTCWYSQKEARSSQDVAYDTIAVSTEFMHVLAAPCMHIIMHHHA
jgi:hypothetical protein